MRDYTSFKSWMMVKIGIGELCANSYIGSVKRFIKSTQIENPTEQSVIDYIMGFHSRGKSYSHIINTSLGLERYAEYIGQPFKLGRPKKPKTIVKNTLTEAEVTRLVAAAKDVREKALISLLAYSGIRNLELCSLRVCDLDLGNNTIRVMKGKGKRDRVICMSGECSRILIDYLNKYQRREEEFLFTTLVQGKRYSTYALRKLVKTLARRAEIQKRVFPHLFRHSIATNLLNRGAQLVTVQAQLGHAHLESTLIYAKSRPQRFQNEYQMFCPSYV